MLGNEDSPDCEGVYEDAASYTNAGFLKALTGCVTRDTG